MKPLRAMSEGGKKQYSSIQNGEAKRTEVDRSASAMPVLGLSTPTLSGCPSLGKGDGQPPRSA